jgi:hypothetical protein
MEKLKIEKMFAFIAIDEEGNEGVTAFQDKRGVWLPLVGADWARVNSLKEIAQEIAKASGQKITLVEFSVRKEIEVL